MSMNRNRYLSVAIFILCSLLMHSAFAQTIKLTKLRVATQGERTRFVFDATGPVKYRDFHLSRPDRFVLDIEKGRVVANLKRVNLSKTPVKDLRSSSHGVRYYRIVFDLKHSVTSHVFTLAPEGKLGYRLVVDMFSPRGGRPVLSKVDVEPMAEKVPVIIKTPTKPVATVPQARPKSLRDVVVVIDPGHGGKDPGATGPGGHHEKTIVLAIAKDLRRMINQQPGFKAELTRKGNYYLTLRGRLAIARKDKADMFVAIHADAFKNSRASGASVYALSERGATSEAARWLAEKENKSELMGGVDLGDKDNMLRSVLINLSQNHTISVSLQIGRSILRQLSKITLLHHNTVEQAAFVVLKSPDIPSLLVESGFISNPKEERQLISPRYQNRLARALMLGIKGYFLQHPPAGTLLAAEKRQALNYVVARGDTLNGIARRYDLNIATLRQANHLASAQLRTGQVLRIPMNAG